MAQNIKVNVEITDITDGLEHNGKDVSQDVSMPVQSAYTESEWLQAQKSMPKTESGIVVNLPMEDYMQLMMLKIQTGRTLKDLALQAVHEFVEKNKIR